MRTKVDEACLRVASEVAIKMLTLPGSPLEAVFILPMWRNEGVERFEAGPTLMGDPEVLPTLIQCLRGVANAIESGDFTILSPLGVVPPKKGAPS